MQYRIGQLAKATEVNIETIRYYQRRGLIKQPNKPNSGFRLYREEDLHRLQFIKRAKTLGFSLDEISTLLTLSEGHCSDVQQMAEEKLENIQAKISDLNRLEKVLRQLIQRCDRSSDDSHCPIIEALLESK